MSLYDPEFNAPQVAAVQNYFLDSENSDQSKFGSFSNYWVWFCEENPSEPECKIYDV